MSNRKPRSSGAELEKEVAQLYRKFVARSVARNINIAGNQVDVYVEEETNSGAAVRAVIECKDYKSPVGIKEVNDFAEICQLLRRDNLADRFELVSSEGFTIQAREAAGAAGIRLVEINDLRMRAEYVRVQALLPVYNSRSLALGGKGVVIRHAGESAHIQPRFRFVFVERNEEGAPDSLEIWNDGEEVESFYILQYCLIEVCRFDGGRHEIRYVPAYYFYDRHYTKGKLFGHLVTMTTQMTQFGLGLRTTNAEVRRLIAEVKQVFGLETTIKKRLYIEIEHADLAGTTKISNFEINLDLDWFGRSRTGAQRLDFWLRAYQDYMSFGPAVPLVGIPGMPRLTGEYVKEHWERYPTPQDLMVRQEQFKEYLGSC